MVTNNGIPIGFATSCLLIIVLLAVEGKADDNEPMSNIRKLKKDLKSLYDKYARPVKNVSTSVPVFIKIGRITLAEVNELEQKMVFDVVMAMNWIDEHLQWEPIDHKGASEIYFEQDEIWHPDVIVFDSSPITNNIPWNKSHISAYANGHLVWFPPASLSIRCPLLSSQPKEEKICNISMASYSYLEHEIGLQLAWTEMDSEQFKDNDNPVWKITKVSAFLEKLTFDVLVYPIATFTVHVKRRYDFVNDLVQGPRTVAILLTLAMFWLPSISDKKMNLGCLVLLVLTGIILYLSSTVISSSVLASTVAPLRTTLFTITSALLMEVIIINLSRLSDIVRPSPILIRILSGMVGRVIGVCPRLEFKEDGGMVRLPETEEEEISQATITIEEEWGLVAMALDRIFFIIYAVIFVIIS